MPKEEKKFILSAKPLALHEISRKGWKYKKIESFGAYDITNAIEVILQRVLLADATALQKM